jgi:hypothetical protein
LSEGNRTVGSLSLLLSSQGDAIGNIEALQEIELVLDERPPRVPDWYILSYLLTFLRHKIKLRFGYFRHWNEVELKHFATAIRHNPFIKAIEQGGVIPTTCLFL